MHIFLAIFFVSTILSIIFLNVTEAAASCGGSKVAHSIVVDKSGDGDFKTVQAAIDSIPSDNTEWYKIQINSGTYKEKVSVPSDKPCIFIQGEGREVTKITYNEHDKTDNSATFTSSSDNVVVKDITFENSYNLNQIKNVKQALSARIYGDKSAFYRCGFVGLQDTIWDVEGRHYFHKCYIEGAVDFIWGSGQSLYEDCQINATAGSLAEGVNYGIITAQGRSSEEDPGGFVFLRGKVSSTGPVLLGRGYDLYSRVIFQETNLLADVVPYGWEAWNAEGQEDLLTYVEENCKGPGLDKSERVSWEKSMDQTELDEFSKSNYIDRDGWIAKQP